VLWWQLLKVWRSHGQWQSICFHCLWYCKLMRLDLSKMFLRCGGVSCLHYSFTRVWSTVLILQLCNVSNWVWSLLLWKLFTNNLHILSLRQACIGATWNETASGTFAGASCDIVRLKNPDDRPVSWVWIRRPVQIQQTHHNTARSSWIRYVLSCA